MFASCHPSKPRQVAVSGFVPAAVLRSGYKHSTRSCRGRCYIYCFVPPLLDNIPTSSSPWNQMEQHPFCIVTGANSGIGKEVAAGLMKDGCHVIMGCRDMAACARAKADLLGRGYKGTCECSYIDLQDFESIKDFADSTQQSLSQKQATLKVLVNNAGVMGVSSRAGEDVHLKVNHLGPYLLTRLLVPDMRTGSRIVNVASRAHYWGTLSIDKQQFVNPPRHWFFEYARSKLCNVLFTQELQQRLQPMGISSFSVSPGLVGTQIFNNVPQPFKTLCNLVAPYVMRTPEKGAETVVYASLSPELEQQSVLFLHDKKYKQASAQARSRELAKSLWDASALAVGLDTNS